MTTAAPPGFGFAPFLASDNDKDPASSADLADLVRVTSLNLHRLALQPSLAAHESLGPFLDSFLALRQRKGSPALEPLDTAVFCALRDVPGLLSSSRRVIDFASLYHPPGVVAEHPSVLIFQAALNPSLERDLQKSFESIASSPGRLGLRRAAGLRGVLEMVPASSSLIRPLALSLRGLRGSSEDALKILGNWYRLASDSDHERAHVRALMLVVLDQLFLTQEQASSFLELLGRCADNDDDDILWDLLADARVRSRVAGLHRSVTSVDEAQCVFAAGILDALPLTRVAEEEVFFNVVAAATLSSNNDSFAAPNARAPDVDALMEIAPHLDREICAAILSAFDGDIERAVASVLDGNLPRLPSDATVATAAPAAANTAALSSATTFTPEPFITGESPPVVEVRIDKVRPAPSLEEYDDEYDDALDGGFAAKAAIASDGEDGLEEATPAVSSSRPLNLVPSQVTPLPPPLLGGPTAASASSRGRGQLLLKSSSSKGTTAPPPSRKKEPRVVDADEYAASVVDVDGNRRDANGSLVVEDPLLRPNRNRLVEPPAATTRKPVPKPAAAAAAAANAITEEERTRRERERKTKQGSRQRTRGADRKQGL